MPPATTLPPDPLQRQRKRFRAEWLALFATLLVIAALVASTLLREHLAAEASEGERLTGETKVVEENLIRQLQGANKALEGIRDDLENLDFDRGDASATGQLKLLTDAMPGVSSMLVLDAGGTIIASSRDGLIGKNFRQREYFDAPHRRPDPSILFVSPPFHTTLGTFVVVVSKALADRTGKFAGVATATLDPAYFDVVLRSVLYAPDMDATLIHSDGKVFLNAPPAALRIKPDMSEPDSLFRRHQRSGLAATLMVGSGLAIGGGDRMVAMRNIDRRDLKMDKPMVIAVSRDTAAIYAPWRDRALQLAALLGVLVVATSLGLHLNQRRRRSFATIEASIVKERQTAAERVELALNGADLGLWDLHVPSNTYVVNPRERELLGYSTDEELPQGPAWRKLIHPDDRSVVNAAIQPHLRGEAPTYECEHRMLHRAGHYVWLFSRAMIVERDASGAPIRIVGTHLDVTERRQSGERLARAAALLRESEVQLRDVTDNLPVLVSRVDLELRFRFANRAYGEWFDLNPASLIGQSLQELYGEAAFAVFRHHVRTALSGRKVVYEREMQTVRGMRQVEVTLVPQRDTAGAVNGLYALISDITDRFRAELLRARSEERLSLALEASSLALFDWDLATGLMYHSAQAAGMRGELAEEITTTAIEFQNFVHPEDLPTVLARMKETVKGTTAFYYVEFRLLAKQGRCVWVRASGRVVQRDDAGRALRLAGTYADITERKLREGRLRQLAEFDSLTGLPNRALFHDRLPQAMARAARGKPMALLFLDVDRFKHINDTLGHQAGDQVLKAFGERMQSAVRQSDTVARLAGDEFTIILEGLNGVADARMLAQKIVDTLRVPVALAERTIEVTVSVGVAMFDPGERDDAALLRRADAALYEAKRLGRNRYFCDESAPRSDAGEVAPTIAAATAKQGTEFQRA